MSFIEEIKERAKKDLKTIILPEAEDRRVLEAANKVMKNGFANVILIGNKKKIEDNAMQYKISLKDITILDIESSEKKIQYAENLYELRKNKGMTLEEANKLIQDPIYYGMMMLKSKEADGLVSGAIHSTADTLRPALQILKTKPRNKISVGIFCNVCSKL